MRLSDGTFKDDLGEISLEVEVRELATEEGPLTYTCVPPGSGVRIGIDRDGDGVLDGLDNCSGNPTFDLSTRNENSDGDGCSVPDLEFLRSE